MLEDKNYNFNEEFNKINQFIEQGLYREAGYSCGYMLEYILLKICKLFIAHAKADVSNELLIIIKKIGENKNDGDLSKFELGKLVGLVNTKSPQKNSCTVLSLAKPILGVDCKNSLTINFNELNRIRNNCVHPYKPCPNRKEIQKIKADLEILVDDFKDKFITENSTPPSRYYSIPWCLITISIILIISILAIFYYLFIPSHWF